MKLIIVLAVALSLVGCAHNKPPTPFTTTNETIVLKGCKDLHEEVKEKNKTLPADKQLVADC